MSNWKHEPKGPGRAERMFVDAGGERVELLAFATSDADGPMIGFEIHGRDRRRDGTIKTGGPFWHLLARGDAPTFEAAKEAALAMAAHPRAEWEKPRPAWIAASVPWSD